MTLTNPRQRANPFQQRWLVLLSLLLALALGFGLQNSAPAQGSLFATLSDADQKSSSSDGQESPSQLTVTVEYGITRGSDVLRPVSVLSHGNQGSFDLALIRAPPRAIG